MRILALLSSRCPHCLQGKVFAGLWRMHETCPVCGIRFEREQGFFMMSVFIGYVICAVLVVPLLAALYMLHADVWWYVGGSAFILIPLAPFIFRYSRVLWLHIDELFDPRKPKGRET